MEIKEQKYFWRKFLSIKNSYVTDKSAIDLIENVTLYSQPI